MAPLPGRILNLLSRSANAASEHLRIPGLSVSSLELDQRGVSASPHNTIQRRAATSTYIPCAGCKPVGSINNAVFFALFAIIGTCMVLASLWFFFWAKNGGFRFQEGAWDDYKSTVLRRKGPDGKTLSNATRSTKLGGGSVVHGQWRQAAKSVIARDEKGRKGILGKRGFAGTHSIGYSDDFTQFDGNRNDDMSEVASQPDRHRGGTHAGRYRDRDVKHYRHEKVARVGGMNRSADGSHFSYSDTATDLSSEPMIKQEKKRAKAEQKAEQEASRMERKWRQEAERAAADLARENAHPPSKKATAPPSKSRTPSPTKRYQPAPQSAKREQRQSSSSRTPSPQKRDYSFSRGPDDASTLYSAPYTAASSGDRSASYYDAYRPQRNSGGPAAAASREPRRGSREQSRSRHSSPQKGAHRAGSRSRAYDEVSDAGTKVYEHHIPGLSKDKSGGGGRAAGAGRDVMAGYRRGRRDSLGDSDDE